MVDLHSPRQPTKVCATSSEMVTLALDTAPWLELPSAWLHASPWASRLRAGHTPSAREAV